MKLHILSDLHLEFSTFDPPATDADVVVLAGDIGKGTNGINWARSAFPDKNIMALWIHGHTHDNLDYEANGTRVICNPRGYVTYNCQENFDFKPGLVIEI